MLHSKFEIDNAWTEGTLRSSKGDIAHVKVNSITKEVWIKTRIGDGNSMDWRKTNTTYESVMSQGFTPISAITDSRPPEDDAAGSTTPPVPILPPPAPTTAAWVAPDKAKPIDLESALPFGKRGKKHD